MIQKETLIKSLDGIIALLDEALRQREQEMQTLLKSCDVDNIFDIDEIEIFKLASELDGQIDDLKDLIDELKHQMRYIGAFKNI